MDNSSIDELLEKNDPKKCLKSFRGMPEKDRRKLAPYCLKLFRKTEKIIDIDERTSAVNPKLKTLSVIMPSVCTFEELKKLGVWGTPDDDLLIQILHDRKPSWIDSLVTVELKRSRYWQSWPLVYRLIREGLCKKPTVLNYYLGMITGLKEFVTKSKGLHRLLIDDPDMIKHDVWKLFESDGHTENSLAMCDAWEGNNSWGIALLKLVKSKHIDRSKLIDATFDALQRDFNHFRAQWFLQMHDELKLTAEERVQRKSRYLDLLRCSAKPVVSWALSQVIDLHKESPYTTKALGHGLEPVLQSPAKGTVKKAIKLLTTSGKGSKDKSIAHAVINALSHSDAVIQKLALDVISQWGDPGDSLLVQKVKDHEGVVAASVRKSLRSWLSADSPKPIAANIKKATRKKAKSPAPTSKLKSKFAKLAGLTDLVNAAENDPFTPTTFDAMNIPRLNPELKTLPISEVDELIETLSRLVEDASDPCEIERALDGVSRLCDRRSDDFPKKTGPLRKRCSTLLKRSGVPFSGYSPVADLCSVALAWIDGEVIGAKIEKGKNPSLVFDYGKRPRSYVVPDMYSPATFLSQRVSQIATRVSKRVTAPLLAAPTHGPWIDPMVLVERIQHWDGPDPTEEEICLAMLRLAPDHRDQALKALGSKRAPWIAPIKFALGGSRIQIGKPARLWLTAARARDPKADFANLSKKFRDKSPDGSIATTYHLRVAKRKFEYVDQEELWLSVLCDPKPIAKPPTPAAFFLKATGIGKKSKDWELVDREVFVPEVVRWMATLWPQNYQSFFAAGSCAVFQNLGWYEAEWQNKEYLLPLLDPDSPLELPGLCLLALGLAAKEPGEHGLAIDIAIAAINDGRLGPKQLGLVMQPMVPTGLLMAGRLAKTLQVVSDASKLHQWVVKSLIETTLRPCDNEPPRDIQKMMRLLLEISIELQMSIADPECRNYLDTFPGKGQARKLSNQLLALEPTDDTSVLAEINQVAMNHSIARIERWEQWEKGSP